MFARRLVASVAGLCFLVPLGMLTAATKPKKNTQAKKSAVQKPPARKPAAATARKSQPRTAVRKAPVHKPTARGNSTAKSRRSKATKPAVTWRNRQTAPAPARYKEIQEALAAKGYLPGESATGEWSASSVDALKHFQTDQNLEPSGRIDSLSLIALGLGPKHEMTASANTAPKPPSP